MLSDRKFRLISLMNLSLAAPVARTSIRNTLKPFCGMIIRMNSKPRPGVGDTTPAFQTN